MSYSVSGTTITLTRGDTFKAVVSITQQDGSPYVPASGDKVRFAMKAKYEDQIPLLVKDIPIDTMRLTLNPEDTKNFDFGKYVYDIQLTFDQRRRNRIRTNSKELFGRLSCYNHHRSSRAQTCQDIQYSIEDLRFRPYGRGRCTVG